MKDVLIVGHDQASVLCGVKFPSGQRLFGSRVRTANSTGNSSRRNCACNETTPRSIRIWWTGSALPGATTASSGLPASCGSVNRSSLTGWSLPRARRPRSITGKARSRECLELTGCAWTHEPLRGASQRARTRAGRSSRTDATRRKGV